MPVFRLSAGPARRRAAAILLSVTVAAGAAGCTTTDPALPVLQPAASPPAMVAPASAFAGYRHFDPGPRDDWRRALAAGDGMTGDAMAMPTMDHGAMDHSRMDHSQMDHGQVHPAMPMPGEATPATPATPPAHQH